MPAPTRSASWRIPGGGKVDAGGISGRGEFLIAAHAERAIGHFKGGDAESRHGADGEPSASDVIDFLLDRHLLKNRVDAAVDFRIRRNWGLCECDKGGKKCKCEQECALQESRRLRHGRPRISAKYILE
jgi:hypothetical protein